MAEEVKNEPKAVLIVTHLQGHYYDVKKAEIAIREYIRRYSPEIYQLSYPNEHSQLLIQEGELFQSRLGEIPDSLRLKIQEERQRESRIILAGGLEGQCLDRTFRGLKKLGIKPKVLFDGSLKKVIT